MADKIMFKRTLFPILLLISTLASCTISGEQEERLNTQLGKYIIAHNQHRLLELIGLTQPDVVRFYKNQGDTLFIAHFKDLRDGDKTYLENAIYRETKTSGKLIQRKYWVAYYTNEEELNHRYCLFALSDDGGDSWLFLRQDDYFNPDITGFKRLFKTP
jgi:hypothetical protein